MELVLCLLFLLMLPCQAQDPSTYFITPPANGTDSVFVDNKVYQLGSTLQLQWKTDIGAYSIFLYQQIGIGKANVGSPIYLKRPSDPEEGTFEWTVTTQTFHLNTSSIFFLQLGRASGSPYFSHYFNVMTGPVSTSASSEATLTATSTTSSATINSSVLSAVFAGTASDAESRGGSTRQAQQIGLGVGLGLGIPLVAVLAGLAYFALLQSVGRRRSLEEIDFSEDLGKLSGITVKEYSGAL